MGKNNRLQLALTAAVVAGLVAAGSIHAQPASESGRWGNEGPRRQLDQFCAVRPFGGP